jgi:hypothetical protein
MLVGRVVGGWRHDRGLKLVAQPPPLPSALTCVAQPSPLPRALTWLLRIGWPRHGHLDPVAPPFTRRDQDDRTPQRGSAWVSTRWP